MRINTGSVTLNILGEYSPAVEKPVLILLHGFTLSSKDWEPLLPHYKKQFQPLAIDIIGHGQSDAPDSPGEYTMSRAVLQIHAVVERLGITACHWIGYSMGGRLVLSYAAEHPDQILSMILESTSPGIEDETDRRKRNMRDANLAKFIEHNTIEKFVDRWTQHPIFKSQQSLPKEKLDQAQTIRLSQSTTGLAHSLREMGRGAMPPLWNALHRMKMPVLLLSGDNDEAHVESHGKMATLLPNADNQIVERAGHNIHFERPEKFIEITTLFYRTLLKNNVN